MKTPFKNRGWLIGCDGNDDYKQGGAMLKAINDAVSFVLELAMLAAYAYAGFYAGQSPVTRYLWAIGLPVLVVIFWANKMAPKAKRQFPEPSLLVVTFVLFELSAGALYVAGATTWAVIFAVVALINVGLRFVFKTSGQQKTK